MDVEFTNEKEMSSFNNEHIYQAKAFDYWWTGVTKVDLVEDYIN